MNELEARRLFSPAVSYVAHNSNVWNLPLKLAVYVCVYFDFPIFLLEESQGISSSTRPPAPETPTLLDSLPTL
jgi:hypothetical protein